MIKCTCLPFQFQSRSDKWCNFRIFVTFKIWRKNHIETIQCCCTTNCESNMFPLLFFYTFRIISLYSQFVEVFLFSLLDKYKVLVAVQCGSQETVPHLVGNANGMRTSRMSQQWALFLSDYFSEDFFWNTFFIGFCIVYFVIIIRLLIKKNIHIWFPLCGDHFV